MSQSRQQDKNQIIAALIGVIGTIIFPFIFKDLKQGIIAGLVTTLICLIFELRILLESIGQEKSTKIFDLVNNNSEKLAELIKVNNEFFYEDELFEILNKIVETRKLAISKANNTLAFKRIIFSAIEQIEKELINGFSIETGDDEWKRNNLLIEIINTAKSYIYALTFDDNQYFKDFWEYRVFTKEYIETNIEAAKRGVRIERIFIVDQKIISGNNLSPNEQSKREHLLKISEDLTTSNSLCKVYWVSKESLPDDMKQSNTSFLVSDDSNASESNGICKGNRIVSYVVYRKPEVVEHLTKRFFSLKNYSKQIKPGQ